MPDSIATALAAAVCLATKPAWREPPLTLSRVVGTAEPLAPFVPLAPPIWRASWRSIASDSPPGMPESCTANCWSSKSVPMASPSLSVRPDFCVASRMLLSSSRMKSDSNCFAASFRAARSLPVAACCRSALRALGSAARPLGMSGLVFIVRSPRARR